MYAVYMVTWIPSIYPSHVSINIPAPAPAGSVMGNSEFLMFRVSFSLLKYDMFRYVSFASLLQWSLSSVRRPPGHAKTQMRPPRQREQRFWFSSICYSAYPERRFVFFLVSKMCPRCVPSIPSEKFCVLVSFVFGLVFPNVFLPRFCLPRNLIRNSVIHWDQVLGKSSSSGWW